MAGDGEDDRMYVLLLFITMFMRLALIRRRSDFNKGCDCLQSEATREQQRSATIGYGGNFVKKIARAFERSQFWFEHMVLTHCVKK